MFDTFSTALHATRLVTRRGSTSNRASLALLVLLLVATSVWSARSSTEVSEYVCADLPCELVVDGSSGLNVLSWDPYIGNEFVPFGFDVHFTGSPTAPAFAGEGRIQAGGDGASYTDPSDPPRCGGYYYVRVYSRGRKFHTPALSSAAPACGGNDNVAPMVSIVTPESNEVLGAAQLFQVMATDEGGSGVAAVLIDVFGRGADPFNASNLLANGNATFDGSNWSLSAALPDGDYDLYANASDVAGNAADQVGPQFFSVQIPTDDTIAPLLTVQSPQNGVTVDMPTTVSGSVSDEGDSGVALVQLYIEDSSGNNILNQSVAPQNGGSWSFEVNGLTDGNYTVFVDTSDGAGNHAVTVQRSISVMNVVDPVNIADGYDDTLVCGTRSADIVTLTATPAPWASDFNATAGEFHDLLASQWKSRYEWRLPDTDVVTNSESQTYLDVLGYDQGFRGEWSPFEQILADGNGYLAIRAAKSSSALPNGGPILNGEMYGGQPYLSGVLTTYETLPLSPAAGQTITVEIKAKMPRGQGLFPAFWAYPIDYAFGPKGSQRNNEFDVFEYIGQSPICDNDTQSPTPECYSTEETDLGWHLTDTTSCPLCPDWRLNNNFYHTQYHNYHKPAKGKLQNIGDSSGYGAVYTNPDGGTPWRGSTWNDCEIDFSAKLHTYTLQWSSDALVVYLDHIKVLEVDETADSTWLPGIDFVPITTEGMALILNVALSSKATYLGAPDAYTEGAMDNDSLKMIVDYVRVWY